MKEAWGKIYSILGKSPMQGEAQDSGELLALLRMSGLIYALYTLVVGVVIASMNGFDYLIPFFAATVIFLACFSMSYVRASLFNNIFSLVIAVALISYLEISTGGKFGIGIAVLGVIPLIFSSIRLSTPVKVIWGVAVLLVHFVASIILDLQLVSIAGPENGMMVVSQITQSFFAILVMLVSFYFCRQFTQAEHQVYVINRQLKKMASLDPLTGLMNRRGMSDVLPDMEEAYKSGNSGLSIAIGDIDFFKKVNDTYGHDCGDYVLKTVSSYFSKYMDGKGEICRWGGEEFLFAFSSKNADDVFVMLNDMRHNIKHMHFEFNNINFNVTMTFGLEEYTPYAQLDTTIKKADEKLYLGKESGRDKVVY